MEAASLAMTGLRRYKIAGKGVRLCVLRLRVRLLTLRSQQASKLRADLKRRRFFGLIGRRKILPQHPRRLR